MLSQAMPSGAVEAPTVWKDPLGVATCSESKLKREMTPPLPWLATKI
jgi:hypothetical protein